MSKVHVRQLETVLNDMYGGLITINSRLNDVKQRDLFCTRSLAAYAVQMISSCSREESIQAITDDFKDNGIDFIHIDETKKQLIIGQSKWTHSGEKSPEYGDILKFIKGVNDLIECKFEKFHEEIKKRSADIERIVTDVECRVLVVIAYSGKQKISDEIMNELDELKALYNDISELINYQILDLKKLHDSIPFTGQGKPIVLTIKIHHYGKIDEPYKALYGRINAQEISQWYECFGEYLFDMNLRKSLSDSNINEQAQNTLLESPDEFWYYNNGITIVCNKYSPAVKGLRHKEMGEFSLEGINIVNGAQTVSNIYKAYNKGANISDAYVMAKIISLEETENDIFSTSITKYTNSQNRITSKNFVTLDPIHKQLNKELQIYGKHYAYKEGDVITDPNEGFSFETAAIALACANEYLRFSMLAKTSVGKLWDNTAKPPYSLLFNSKTTALRVLRSVNVLHRVNQQLKKINWPGSLVTHSNRFLTHMVFIYIPVNKFDDPDLNFDFILQSIENNFNLLFEIMRKKMNLLYPNAHVYHFFRNGGKCQALKDAILADLIDPFNLE